MNNNKNITEEQLNALIDGELPENMKAEVLKMLDENPELAKKISKTRQDMDFVSLAYGSLQMEKSFDDCITNRAQSSWFPRAVAASLLLAIGMVVGWVASDYRNQTANVSFSLIEDYDPAKSRANKIIVHVNSMDIDRVYRALAKLEEALNIANETQSNIQLKFIANSEGFAVLRQGSPYAEKIKLLAGQYNNVEFLACGVAMKAAKQKEKQEIILLPEARRFPIAANAILASIKDGWLYTRP